MGRTKGAKQLITIDTPFEERNAILKIRREKQKLYMEKYNHEKQYKRNQGANLTGYVFNLKECEELLKNRGNEI